jgi:hypothetical protein
VDSVVLLHDNARPYVANTTAAQLQSIGWEIVEHAPHRPDLALVMTTCSVHRRSARGFPWTVWFCCMTAPGLMWQTTAAQLQSIGWEIVEHAPHSPDLAPVMTTCSVHRRSARGFPWTVWFCCMTAPGLLWQTPRPPNCSQSDGRLWSMHHIVQTSPQ